MENALKHILICSYKAQMIAFMGEHPECFEEAIKLAISDEPLFSWRAAWLLWSCMEENDPRMQKYIRKVIHSLKNKNDGHQRELLKILMQMELKEQYESILFNLCIEIWEQINKNPSVRITALKFIIKIAKKYPELSQEVSFLAQEPYLESLSPGVKRSVSKMMMEFTRQS